jgi:hypothetical protein
MSGANSTVTVGQPMNEDIASRRDAFSPRLLAVLNTRVGDVDRLVELTVRIAKVEKVSAFGVL